MPLKKEVDHAIELVHGVVLTTKAPCRHYFKENIELETQLKVMLNKVCIRTSKSLWGALYYFKRKNDSLRFCVD